MFRHELARLSVVEEVPQLRRIALHRQILEALDADAAADPARRAHHAEAAGLGDEAARHALVAAGRAASLGAHKEAVQQYERVLRHSDGAPAEHRARLLAALSYERYVTGRIAEALAARREALAIWLEVGDVDEVGDAQRWLSRLSWFAGDSADAEDVRHRRLRDAGRPGDARRGDGPEQPRAADDAGRRPGRYARLGRPGAAAARHDARRVLGSRTCGCTRSTTSAPSSSRAATPSSGLGCCRRASTVPSRPTCTSTRPAPSPTWVRWPCASTGTRTPGGTSWPASTTASSGTWTPGTTTCGAGSPPTCSTRACPRRRPPRPSRSCATPAPPRSAGSGRSA